MDDTQERQRRDEHDDGEQKVGKREVTRQKAQHGEAEEPEQGAKGRIDRGDAERKAYGEFQSANASLVGRRRALSERETRGDGNERKLTRRDPDDEAGKRNQPHGQRRERADVLHRRIEVADHRPDSAGPPMLEIASKKILGCPDSELTKIAVTLTAIATMAQTG